MGVFSKKTCVFLALIVSAGCAQIPNRGSRLKGDVTDDQTDPTSSNQDPAKPTDPGQPVAKEVFNPCPPQGKPCVIMPLGDSITNGTASKSGGGYREVLFHKALEAKQQITFVGNVQSGPQTVDGKPFPRNHEGHSGYTITDTDKRHGIFELVEASLKKNKPNIITLMIGTNDVDTRFDLPAAGTRLANLVDRILKTSPDALLVLAKIVPTRNDSANNLVRAYNDTMDQIVKDRADAGKHIVLVDMYKAITAVPDYKTKLLNDNLHPNEAGFKIMGDVWFEAIGSLWR